MARNCLVRTFLLRQVLRNGPFSPLIVRSSSSLKENLISHYLVQSPTVPTKHFSSNYASNNTRFNFPNCRTLSSSSGPSNVVLIKTEEEFNNSLSKAQDESVPAIFYYTAAWCGPCRFIAPKISELSEQYPHVTTYKVDIDEAGIQNSLRKLAITSVPTFYFFQNGKKVSELIGADVQQLTDTMEIYKKD